jgi:NAD(P)-dependent dehydrogenase (short-subunit alcohol dehydrogenase family)
MFDKIVQESGDRARVMLQEVEDSVPMGRLGAADDIAAAVTWLCSDAASFVTGTAMPVDGGFVVG